jgi:hypothetical protein
MADLKDSTAATGSDERTAPFVGTPDPKTSRSSVLPVTPYRANDPERDWRCDLLAFNDAHNCRDRSGRTDVDERDDSVQRDYAASRFLSSWRHPAGPPAPWPDLTTLYRDGCGARSWNFREPGWWLVQFHWRCDDIYGLSWAEQVTAVQNVIGARLYDQIIPILLAGRRTPQDILWEMPYDTEPGRATLRSLLHGLAVTDPFDAM